MDLRTAFRVICMSILNLIFCFACSLAKIPFIFVVFFVCVRLVIIFLCIYAVALRVRAWIEIDGLKQQPRKGLVALRVRAWIEMQINFPSVQNPLVALRVRAWIEIGKIN